MDDKACILQQKKNIRELELQNQLLNIHQEESLDGIYTFCQIKDSGHGINPKSLSRIFKPFYTTKFVGRGLGLPENGWD